MFVECGIVIAWNITYMKQSKTNDTTAKILEFLTKQKVFCWRQNVAPIPVARAGSIVGFRSGGKSGISDIVAVLPPTGRGAFIEVKTGKDKLRPEQEGFKRNVTLMGAIYMEVKDFEDFQQQWEKLSTEN